MPQQMVSAIESTFNRGLITEATGLNFPTNASTDCNNVRFTIPGDVVRRSGIDLEVNGAMSTLASRVGCAVTSYKWNNVGGDGDTQFEVVQNGNFLYFYDITNSTTINPLTNHYITSLDLSFYIADGAAFDNSIECQYSDGNGYLFVFHSNCDPVYCNYNNKTVSAYKIDVRIRDMFGIPEPGVSPNARPLSLTPEHNYNLKNQGWTTGNSWLATSTDLVDASRYGQMTWTVQSGIANVTNGQLCSVFGRASGSPEWYNAAAIVIGYSGTSLTLNVISYQTSNPGDSFDNWTIYPDNTATIDTWKTDEGNYPSNADVWWYFKDTSGVFNPTNTQPNVTLSAANAPRGYFILSAFNMDRTTASSVSGLTTVNTTVRPTTGAWFQGRVWYTGVAASQQASGDAPFFTWSENIYFSQVNLGTDTNFGSCYQVNDPTSENLFSILPTDGGVIQIQGAGLIYKLFPVQNGMLVFATNGVWFITGSTGIGFAADDYTITKISSVEILSSNSFVDVMGLPFFWNLEGIYTVQTEGNKGLSVTPITVETIRSFYNNIPRISKVYARGAYNPVTYELQWIYKTTNETSVTDRYSFDGLLTYNTFLKAFYPFTVDNSATSINSITYIQGPESVDAQTPAFRYFISSLNPAGDYIYGFADEHDTTYTDWKSVGGINFTSYFITGYNSPNMFSPSTMDRSKGIGKFQAPYVFTYSRSMTQPTAFYLQSVWDFGVAQDSNRWSAQQLINTYEPNYGMVIRRSRLRGMGLVMQIKISSVDGLPFDIMGWTLSESVNARP